MKTPVPALLACTTLLFVACKKESAEPPAGSSTPVSTTDVLNGFASNIATANYADLANKTALLLDSVTAFNTASSEARLDNCRQAWRDARNAWEQSEACLFGPVSTGNIDPRIDTWPVNFTDLEAQLASPAAFDATYINGLEDALKGFHPIEYLLWGQNGSKTAAQFTAREKEYLQALTVNLSELTAQLSDAWDAGVPTSYHYTFAGAGSGNVVYTTQRAAFEELVNAMAGICDEVGNGKIAEPYLQQDPALEESPFSGNSMTDFRNNIRGVENVYLGRYQADGAALEDLVRQYDLQLDATVKQHISAAETALNNVTLPFGEAIIAQPVQVQNAIDAINALAAVLNDELLPFVRSHTN